MNARAMQCPQRNSRIGYECNRDPVQSSLIGGIGSGFVFCSAAVAASCWPWATKRFAEMSASTNRRTVKLELPNGLVRRITLRAARFLVRERHASFVAHAPMTVRLHLWAVPHYRRLFFWGNRSDGNAMTGGGLMHCLPRWRRKVELDADSPEEWVEKNKIESRRKGKRNGKAIERNP